MGALILAVILLAGCQEHHFEDTTRPGQITVKDDLYAATALGRDHLWVAGYFGAVYHTSDGGKTFRRLPTETEKSLYDISFSDEKNGWAVGRRGFVIHTADGGLTWDRQKLPRFPPRHIFAVHAVDARTAWVVGDWGSRFVTRDGGATWEDASLLVDENHPTYEYLNDEDLEKLAAGEKVYDDTYLNDVFFLDARHGWIAAEYGMIFYTRDGGETWAKGQIIGKDVFDGVTFESAVSDVSRDQWQQLFTAAERLNDKQHLRVRIEGFLTPAELRKTGETSLADDRARAVADFLEGEGVTQDRIRILNETPFDEESVDMKAFTQSKLRDHGYAVIRVIETPFLFDIKFQDAQHGVIAGLGGVVLQTDDGGETWSYRDTQTRQALFGIDVGSQAVFTVGERGLSRQSLDGGATFARPKQSFQEELGIYGFMRDIAFGSPEVGWIVGATGLVLKTEDGGLTWNPIDVAERSGQDAKGSGQDAKGSGQDAKGSGHAAERSGQDAKGSGHAGVAAAGE